MTHVAIVVLVSMIFGAAFMMMAISLFMSNKKSSSDNEDLSNSFFITYRDKNNLGLPGGEINVYKYGEHVNTISGRMADDIWKWLTEVKEQG